MAGHYTSRGLLYWSLWLLGSEKETLWSVP